jgi:hypothetical protein
VPSLPPACRHPWCIAPPCLVHPPLQLQLSCSSACRFTSSCSHKPPCPSSVWGSQGTQAGARGAHSLTRLSVVTLQPTQAACALAHPERQHRLSCWGSDPGPEVTSHAPAMAQLILEQGVLTHNHNTQPGTSQLTVSVREPRWLWRTTRRRAHAWRSVQCAAAMRMQLLNHLKTGAAKHTVTSTHDSGFIS